MRSLYYVRKMTVFSKQGATNAIKTRQSRRKPVTQSYRAFQMAASCNQSAAVRAVFFCFYKNNGHYLKQWALFGNNEEEDGYEEELLRKGACADRGGKHGFCTGVCRGGRWNCRCGISEKCRHFFIFGGER